MMTARLLRRPTSDATRAGEDGRNHPEWCAHTHACGLGEHRARPVRLEVPGRASVVLTRVMGTSGRQHVEIRTSVTLAPGDEAARAHLAHVLTELEGHLRHLLWQPIT
jgi:hypothetical protein